MYERKLNGILADEMGLGKTIQTIGLLAWLACEKGILFFVVIMTCLSKQIFHRNLGTTSRSCTNFSYAQLGNGVQEMVSFVQNLNLLWKSKRSTAKTNG